MHIVRTKYKEHWFWWLLVPLGLAYPYQSLCLLPYGYTMAAVIPYVRLKFKARKEGGLNWIYVVFSLAKVVS